MNTCARCHQATDHVDDESQHRIHPACLLDWWSVCEPLPAPIVIRCSNGPDVIVSRGVVQRARDTDDDPDLLRRRGVFTAA